MNQHLSMPDPCPHLNRLDLIRAKLHGGDELDEVLEHLNNCDRKPLQRNP